jgi:hypothetical protein
MITQVRIARPTHQLEKLVEFYCEGLGLPKIGSFTGHAGYDGVMIGLPGTRAHLEFTQQKTTAAYLLPSLDNLLVLYIPEKAVIEEIANRLAAKGSRPVLPDNPYWEVNGLTFEDPDGWRVVLYRGAGLSAG